MKRLIAAISLIIILGCGVYAVPYMQQNVPITYDGSNVDVYELQQNPQDYDTSDPDGVASIIVQENLAKTQAVNNVTAIVFDFIAITGATVILRRKRDRWEGGKK